MALVLASSIAGRQAGDTFTTAITRFDPQADTGLICVFLQGGTELAKGQHRPQFAQKHAPFSLGVSAAIQSAYHHDHQLVQLSASASLQTKSGQSANHPNFGHSTTARRLLKADRQLFASGRQNRTVSKRPNMPTNQLSLLVPESGPKTADRQSPYFAS